VIPVQYQILVLTGVITDSEALLLTNLLYRQEWVRLEKAKAPERGEGA